MRVSGPALCYAEVRALQRWLRSDRRRFRKASDPLAVKRHCIQYANDCAFCNPPPQSDDAARDRWAARWYALYASKAGL